MREAERFRGVMSHFATGVTVVTGADAQGRRVGLTANAFTSVSLDPPLVLVCVGNGSRSREAFLETSRFAVGILRREDEFLAHRFAGDTSTLRFDDLSLRTEVTGAPILERALAWLDCRLWKVVEAGDHTVLFGEVVACGVGGDANPLVFFQGSYQTVDS